SSLSIALSSSASANSFFSRTFSPSSSLSRLASFALRPPYWATQRCQVDSAISRCRHTSSSSPPPAKSLLPSASLRMIWSGVCRRRVMGAVLLPQSGATDSHTTWTTTKGSPHLRHAEEVTGNVAMTCRYYGISRQCFYVWKRRYDELGEAGLVDRSHRPKT